MTHKTKHIYTCDLPGCGVVDEYAGTHQMPSVHITVEPGKQVDLNFCTVEHLAEWLKAHGLEEMNG